MSTEPTNSVDEPLVRAALRGDVAAFEALIVRHSSLVHAIAMAHLRDPEAAQDLAQEVFLRVCLHLGQLRPPLRFGPWVSRITRNLALDWKRRAQRASRLLPTIPLDDQAHRMAQTSEREVREIMSDEDDTRALHRALGKLPPAQRELVLLHFAEGLDQREIAERLGVHPATVGRHLRRALRRMRGLLEETLRREAAPLRMPRQLPSRTAAVVAAASALSAVERASLAASSGLPSALSSGALGPATALAPLCLTGVKTMATVKGIATAAAVAVVTAGAIVAVRQSSSERGPEPAAEQVPTILRGGDYPARFGEVYALASGENLKLVSPPFIPERDEFHRGLFQSNQRPPITGSPDSMTLWDSGGTLMIHSMTSTGGQGAPLSGVVANTMDLFSEDLEGDADLLATPITADIVVRRGLDPEEAVPALEQCLQRDLGLPVRLVFRDVPRSVLVVGGRYQPHPRPGSSHDLEILLQGSEFQLANSVQGGGHRHLLDTLRSVTHRRIVDETVGQAGFFLNISVQSGPQPSDPPSPIQQFCEQTGFTVTEETRVVRQLFVERLQ
ncbi:RNA polymerase sigma factor [Candidatus Sumerlaeota bacterium]|nr:RNA polymerase sigma factor [Candidatus Sumerlaeota bacterium]